MSNSHHVITVADSIWDLLCYQAQVEGRPIREVIRAALLRYLDHHQTAKMRASNKLTDTSDLLTDIIED